MDGLLAVDLVEIYHHGKRLVLLFHLCMLIEILKVNIATVHFVQKCRFSRTLEVWGSDSTIALFFFTVNNTA